MLGLRCGPNFVNPRLLSSVLHTRSISSTSILRYASERHNTSGKGTKKLSELDVGLSRADSMFKTYKPVTPGLRHLKRPLNLHLYEGRPIRALTIPLRKNGGRNNKGRITVRHRGGGHKQRLRTVDFKRLGEGVKDVVRIEYDPGRSAHIALLHSREAKAEGSEKWSYILATDGMRAGDTVRSFRKGIPKGFVPGFDNVEELQKKAVAATGVKGDQMVNEDNSSAEALALGVLRTLILKPGNVLPLRLIPAGTVVHNICLQEDGPGRLVRSAGTFGQVIGHEPKGRYAHVRLQSGEVRQILETCCATVGKVSNPLWQNNVLGKAGRSRWLGWRPSVRGMAMNAVDHAHGGGRGKSKSNKHPVSIWGWGTKGTRTRKPGPKGPKNSNKMVIYERPRGVDKRALGQE